MFCDYHVHLDKTEWSASAIGEMCEQARRAGVDRIGIVVHTKCLSGFEPLYAHLMSRKSRWRKLTFDKDIDRYFEVLKEAQSSGYPVDIGAEVCYSPEGEDFLRRKLKEYPFDYTIGSVHLIHDMHYKTAVETYRDERIVGEMYYALVLKAVESGLFNIAGHIEIARREGIPSLMEYPDILDRLCGALLDNGCAVEINTKWLGRYGFLVPERDTLSIMAQRGVPVVFGSDAHHKGRIGFGKNLASAAIREAGYRGFSRIRSSSPPDAAPEN